MPHNSSQGTLIAVMQRAEGARIATLRQSGPQNRVQRMIIRTKGMHSAHPAPRKGKGQYQSVITAFSSGGGK